MLSVSLIQKVSPFQGAAEPLPIAEGISSFDIGRGKVLEDIVALV